jgi:hypothetical protein
VNSPDLVLALSDRLGPFTDQLRLAVTAYLARFKCPSREHTESDLRCFLAWCAGNGLDPLAVRRLHLEVYIRWMQKICRFKPCRGEFASFRTHAGLRLGGLGLDDRGVPSWLLRRGHMTSLGDA